MFGQEPVTLVEIDQDYCGESYGIAPCDAAVGVTGTQKCFNTYRSCQSAANFNLGEKTLRFAVPFQAMPLEWNAIPSVASVKSSPSTLNIGGRNKKSGALGIRGSVTVTFTDHPDGDIKTDPYLSSRSYDPFETGTFWTKWLARNVYYKNRPLRIYQGYLGQDISEMKVSHYVIEKITGPDASGRVTITGSDVLRLLDDDKTQWPVASTGELGAAISGDTISITNTDDGDYESSNGYVRISDEIIGYTSAVYSGGLTTLSGLTRGVFGSEVEEHSVEDKVQRCVYYDNQMPHDVVYDLMVNAGSIDPSFIPYSAWDDEATIWLPQFRVTSIISEPTGVNESLRQLMTECLFYIWWDERTQRIEFRAVRPATEETTAINEDGHILEGSLKASEDPSQRVSQVWVYYQPRNWAGDSDKAENYKKVRLSVDLPSQSRIEYDEKKVKEIFCRWIDTDAKALSLGARFIAQYRDTPKFITFSTDAKDRDTWTGDMVDINCWLNVDFYGERVDQRYQIISAKEKQAGEVIEYEAQLSIYVGGKFAFWMEDDAKTYTNSTEVERRAGAWWSDDDGKMPDGSDGYTWQ